MNANECGCRRPEGAEKERYVERLFASIAPRYDLLNSVISFGRHGAWRRFAVKKAGLKAGDDALDVAAGTGDFSFELVKAVGAAGSVTALDFCEPMVEIGKRKAASRRIDNVEWVIADAAELPFPENTFDCATIAFGLRNVGDVSRTISEMARVIKPGGRVVSLEIVKPTSVLVKPFWTLYFLVAMPLIARVFGGKREAYTYLPESVKRFHTRQELLQIMTEAGLKDARFYDLTGGVVCVHVGVKR